MSPESGFGTLRELDVPVVVRTAPLALAMALMITLCHTPPGTRNLMTVRLPTRARTAALQRAAAGWSAAARDQNEAAMGSYLALLAVAAVCMMARSLGPRWSAALLGVASLVGSALAYVGGQARQVRHFWEKRIVSRLRLPGTQPVLWKADLIAVEAAPWKALWARPPRGARRRGRNRKCGWWLVILLLLAFAAQTSAHQRHGFGDDDTAESPWLNNESLGAVASAGATALKVFLSNVQGKTSTRGRSGEFDGVGDSIEAVRSEMARHGANVGFLTETCHADAETTHLSFGMSDYNCFWSDAPLPEKRGGARRHKGCAVILRKDWVADRPIQCKPEWRHAGGRGIIVAVQQEDTSWIHFISIYASPRLGAVGSAERADVADLADWLSQRLDELVGCQVVVGGDMNAVRRPCDRRTGKLTKYDSQESAVPQILFRAGFVDVAVSTWGEKQLFTQYESNTSSVGVSRIDQIHVSAALIRRHPGLLDSAYVGVDLGGTVASTHRAVVAVLDVVGSVNHDEAEAEPTIQYSKLDAKIKDGIALAFKDEGAVMRAKRRTSEAREVAAALGRGTATPEDARTVFGELWVSWAKEIVDTVAGITTQSRRGCVTRNECSAGKTRRAASALLRALQQALATRPSDGSRRVPQETLSAIRRRVDIVNKLASDFVPIPKPGDVTWNEFGVAEGRCAPCQLNRGMTCVSCSPTYATDAIASAQAVIAWSRSKKNEWKSAKCKGGIARREKDKAEGRGNKVIQSVLHTWRVPAQLGSVPCTRHHSHEGVEGVFSHGSGAGLRCPQDCCPCRSGVDVACQCATNAVTTDPTEVKESTGEFFKNWTRASKGPPPGIRQVGHGPDAEYHVEAHVCTCEREWQVAWARAKSAHFRFDAAARRAASLVQGSSDAEAQTQMRVLVDAAVREAGGDEAQAALAVSVATAAAAMQQSPDAAWRRAKNAVMRSEPPQYQCSRRCRLMQALQPSDHLEESDWADLSKVMTWEDWTEILKSFDTGKSAGGSQVRIELIRALPKQTQTEMMNFINAMMGTNCVPAVLLEARMATLHKKVAKPFGLGNIRPISLLEVVLKIMDKHHMRAINKCLLKKKTILGSMQHAFSPGRGVSSPLIANELVNEDAAASEGDRTAWTAYHDVAKAYDSVEFWAQEVALRRMKLPAFFIDYWREVSRRGTTRVQTKHGLTDPYPVERGVRQGAVLSPIIFNFFMEALTVLLQQEEAYKTRTGAAVHGAVFADDVWNVSSSYSGIRSKAATTAYFLGFHGMTMNAEKTHFTATWEQPDGISPPPIKVRVWKKGYYASDDGFVDELIPFRSPTAKARYLGLWFLGTGCSAESFTAMNGKFHQAISQMNSRRCSYSVAAYVMQAVLYARLGYGMAVVIPDTEDCGKWQSMANGVLTKALQAVGLKRAVLFAERQYGGLGGKSLLRIRDEVAVTTVLSLLNGPDSVTARLLQDCLCPPGVGGYFGCAANPGGEKVGGFAGRFRTVLQGLDCALLRRDVGRHELSGPTPREVLGLEYGSPGHNALRRKGVTRLSQLFSLATKEWLISTRGPGKTALVRARRAVTTLVQGKWVLPPESPITTLLDDEEKYVLAERGGPAYGMTWYPDSCLPVLPPASDSGSALWYTDGSMKPDFTPAKVGWAAVKASEAMPPPIDDIPESDVESAALGITGTSCPGVSTAESTGMQHGVRRSAFGADIPVEIRSDSLGCKRTFDRLNRLTSRNWMRLSCRWIWRETMAHVNARREAGQEVEVTWVRAHTDGKDAKSQWNDRVDHKAKEAADRPPPEAVLVPAAEAKWVLLHERKAVVSDVSKFIGQLHARRASRILEYGKWMPVEFDNIDRMAVAHVTKAAGGVDLQMRAARLWARNGLRTLKKIGAMNPDSALAELLHEEDVGCPLCGMQRADSEHILTECNHTAYARAAMVAEFFSTLSCYGRWGWWGGLRHRRAELKAAIEATKSWMKKAGVRGRVRAAKGVVHVRVGRTEAPVDMWRSLAETCSAKELRASVEAAIDVLTDKEEECQVRQLPRPLVEASCSRFQHYSRCRSKEVSHGGGCQQG